jgi:hypothetical protein
LNRKVKQLQNQREQKIFWKELQLLLRKENLSLKVNKNSALVVKTLEKFIYFAYHRLDAHLICRIFIPSIEAHTWNMIQST